MKRNISLKKSLRVFLAVSLLAAQTPASISWAAPLELSLADSLAMAYQNNPTAKIADVNRSKAASGVREAKGGRLPTVSLGSTYILDQNQPGVTSSADGSDLSSSLRLNLPLYTGGRTEAVIKQAELGEDQARLDVAKTRQQLKLDVTSAYYNVLQSKDLAKVSQETVDNMTQHLQNVQAKYEVGTVAKSDVLRSEVELANARQNLLKAQNGYDLSVASLANLIGASVDEGITLKDELEYEAQEVSLEGSIAQAAKSRPEVVQASLGVSMAQQGVKAAKSGHKPTLAAGGSISWQDAELPDTDDDNWTVSLSASWNVFDGGVTRAKVKSADDSVKQARLQEQQVRDNVTLEVRQAYLSLKEAEKRVETTQVAVSKAEEDLFIAREQYNAGVGTNLDVIDAQLALAQSRNNYTQALYDHNISKAKLDKATGSDLN